MLSIVKNIVHAIRNKKLLFLKKKVKIGAGFRHGKGCFISKKNTISIGDNFFMGNYCHLASDLKIGNDVLLASFVSCIGGDHKIDHISVTIRESGRDVFKTTTIEDNVWVGQGVILMHGVTLRKGSVIAAGSVVTKDVEENAIVGGNPAKLIRYRKVK
ncbi:acyltransferase [Flavobacteriaceae sp. LMIT009]